MADPQTTILCGCKRCVDERVSKLPETPSEDRLLGPTMAGWRYACEKCGNKRCPHHTNHAFPCTGSNAVGQDGSAYQ